MSDSKLLIQLRDCFQGGYTLPQYCLDNGINRPLFLGRKNILQFVWEVHTQFQLDKRFRPEFCLLDSSATEIDFSVLQTFSPIKTQIFSKDLVNNCDRIFFLSTDKSRFNMPKTVYLDDLVEQFIRKTYAEIPILSFLQRYPKVKFFLTNFPNPKRYKQNDDSDKKLPSLQEMLKRLDSSESGEVETPLDRFGYTNREVLDMIRAPRYLRKQYGRVVLEDTSRYSVQRIRGGKRTTAYQPDYYRNQIWFVGSCHQYGINAPYDKTLESYLQRMLNSKRLPWRVENEGQHYVGRRQDCLYNLHSIKPVPGDIIFAWVNNVSDVLPFFDTADAFDSPNDYREAFAFEGYVNELGYKLLAQKYFNFLTDNDFFRDVEFNYPSPPPPPRRFGIPPQYENFKAPPSSEESPVATKNPFVPSAESLNDAAKAEVDEDTLQSDAALEVLLEDAFKVDEQLDELKDEPSPQLDEPKDEPSPQLDEPKDEPSPQLDELKDEPSPQLDEPKDEPSPQLDEPKDEPSPQLDEPKDEPSPQLDEPKDEPSPQLDELKDEPKDEPKAAQVAEPTVK